MDKSTGGSRRLVADNLRRLRRSRGLSQDALGDLAGLHRTFVGHVERAETNASIDSLDRLANALGVQARMLFDPETSQLAAPPTEPSARGEILSLSKTRRRRAPPP